MEDNVSRFVFLPGAGGDVGANAEIKLASFARELQFAIQFDVLRYPGWKLYVQEDFSGEKLVENVVAEITRKIPDGPIGILGYSLGGHLGYAAAVRLLQQGREISLFCAMDSFMPTPLQQPDWKSRVVTEALELLRKRRMGDLVKFVKVKARRAVIRLTEKPLIQILRKLSTRPKLAGLLHLSEVAEQDLNMRMLLRVMPWIKGLDQDPTALAVPTALLRTAALAQHDRAWRKRCPAIQIREIPGKHLTLFERDNIPHVCEAFASAVGCFPGISLNRRREAVPSI